MGVTGLVNVERADEATCSWKPSQLLKKASHRLEPTTSKSKDDRMSRVATDYRVIDEVRSGELTAARLVDGHSKQSAGEQTGLVMG